MIDSAKRPLDGAQWWMTAEKPFQTLAACIEISNALDSGNTETYESGVPVYQFGFLKKWLFYFSVFEIFFLFFSKVRSFLVKSFEKSKCPGRHMQWVSALVGDWAWCCRRHCVQCGASWATPRPLRLRPRQSGRQTWSSSQFCQWRPGPSSKRGPACSVTKSGETKCNDDSVWCDKQRCPVASAGGGAIVADARWLDPRVEFDFEVNPRRRRWDLWQCNATQKVVHHDDRDRGEVKSTDYLDKSARTEVS